MENLYGNISLTSITHMISCEPGKLAMLGAWAYARFWEGVGVRFPHATRLETFVSQIFAFPLANHLYLELNPILT